MFRAVALSPAVATIDVIERTLDWIEAHPVLLGYLLAILTYLSTAILTAWKKPATQEEYARLSAKTAAFWKIVGGALADVPAIRKGWNEWKNGYVPRAERVTLPDVPVHVDDGEEKSG